MFYYPAYWELCFNKTKTLLKHKVSSFTFLQKATKSIEVWGVYQSNGKTSPLCRKMHMYENWDIISGGWLRYASYHNLQGEMVWNGPGMKKDTCIERRAWTKKYKQQRAKWVPNYLFSKGLYMDGVVAWPQC